MSYLVVTKSSWIINAYVLKFSCMGLKTRPLRGPLQFLRGQRTPDFENNTSLVISCWGQSLLNHQFS